MGRASDPAGGASHTRTAPQPSPPAPLLLYRYHTEGFLQKNNNMLHSDLELVLKAATDPCAAAAERR